jgi:ribosome-binding factor A
MSNIRTRRVAELIHRELANLLRAEIEEFLSLAITIIDVEVSPDFSLAKIFVSFHDEKRKKEVMQMLHKEAGHLRYLLAQKMNLRVTPKLIFLFDDTISKGNKLSKLIDQAVASDQETKDE